jgi:head-tail adaptor
VHPVSGLARFMVHDLTLLEPATSTNRYGDTVADWSAPPMATYSEKGWLARTGTSEMADGREAITDDVELTVLATSALTETMRVVYRGSTYEVRGSIHRAETPTGTSHLTAQLRKVAG